MSDFSFEIEANPSSANAEIAGVEGGLRRVEDQAKKTGAAIDGAFQDKNGRWRNAQGQFLLLGSSARAAGAQAADGLRQPLDPLAKIDRAAKAAAFSMGDIVAVVGFSKIIHEAEQLADGYLEIQNRLRVVSESQENLNGLMTATFQVAQDTRTEWEQVASTYQRLAVATEHLGLSQQAVIDLTREIGQSLVVAGANAQESRMAMMELVHGFELGALTGREFRVLLKDATPLIGSLAKALDIPRAKFIEMGKHGQITSKLLVDGFAKAAPEIAEKFALMTPTIGQSFTVLENAAKKFFGEAGAGSGVMRTLADAIRFVADNMETFGKILLGVLEAVIALYAIEKLIYLVKALTAAIAANPFGAILVVITVGISLLRQFGDQWGTSLKVIDSTGVHAVTVADYLRGLWEMIKDLGRAIVDFLDTAWTRLTSALSDGVDGSGMEFSLRNVLLFIASFVDAGVALFKAMASTIHGVFIGLTKGIGELFVDLARWIVSGIQAAINGMIHAYNKVHNLIHGTASKRLAATEEAFAPVNGQDTTAIDLAQARNEAGAKYGHLGVYDAAAVKALGLPAGTDVEAERQKFVEARLRELTDQRLQSAYARRGLNKQGGEGIEDVDLSFANPLAGETDRAHNMIRDAWGKDFGSSVARDWVNGFADELEKRAEAAARERLANAAKKKPDYVKTTGGPEGAETADDKALKKLQKELDSIERKSNPITKAQLDLAKAVDVTDRAMRAHLVTQKEADEIVSDLAVKTAEVREPMLAWVRNMEREDDLLRMTTGERERANAIREAENSLKEKGVTIDEKTIALVERNVDAQRGEAAVSEYQKHHLDQLQETINGIREPLDQFGRKTALLKELQRDGAITAKEYAAATRETQEALFAAGKARPSTERAAADAWREMIKNATNTADAMKTAFTNAYAGIETGLVEMVTKGKTDWHAMVESMLGDLTRLLIRQALVSGLTATGIIPSVPVFAAGGSFMVGGQGGTDSQIVAFRASPNERVTVSNPSQAGSQDRRGDRRSRGERMDLRVVLDRGEQVSAMDTRAGERVVMGAVIRNMDTLRSHIRRT